MFSLQVQIGFLTYRLNDGVCYTRIYWIAKEPLYGFKSKYL